MTKRYVVVADRGLYQVWKTDGPTVIASHMDKPTAHLLCAALNAGLTVEAIEGKPEARRLYLVLCESDNGNHYYTLARWYDARTLQADEDWADSHPESVDEDGMCRDAGWWEEATERDDVWKITNKVVAFQPCLIVPMEVE